MHFGLDAQGLALGGLASFFRRHLLPPLQFGHNGIHLTKPMNGTKEGKYNNVLVIYVTQQP